jgi:hypothetical protein
MPTHKWRNVLHPSSYSVRAIDYRAGVPGRNQPLQCGIVPCGKIPVDKAVFIPSVHQFKVPPELRLCGAIHDCSVISIKARAYIERTYQYARVSSKTLLREKQWRVSTHLIPKLNQRVFNFIQGSWVVKPKFIHPVLTE